MQPTTESIFLERRRVELELGSNAAIGQILSIAIDAVNEVFPESNVEAKISFRSAKTLNLIGFDQMSIRDRYAGYLRFTDWVSGLTDGYAHTHPASFQEEGYKALPPGWISLLQLRLYKFGIRTPKGFRSKIGRQTLSIHLDDKYWSPEQFKSIIQELL